MTRVEVTYVGGPGLPSHGLDPQLPRLGKLKKGVPRIANLDEARLIEARSLPGVEVKLIPLEGKKHKDDSSKGREIKGKPVKTRKGKA